jgi:hypothetical protein
VAVEEVEEGAVLLLLEGDEEVEFVLVELAENV